MRVTLDDAVVVPEDVVFRDLDGEGVVLNLATGIYFGLDDVATTMWRLCETHRSLRKVLDHLVEEFDTPRDRVERDLLGFVATLIDKGLLART